jgi:hypothetical protein
MYIDYRQKRKNLCILHLDATGNIASLGKKQVKPYLYTLTWTKGNYVTGVKVLDDQTRLRSFLDFITNDNTTKSISTSLNTWISSLNELTSISKILPDIIITDKSFALINAILISMNQEASVPHLHKLYAIFVEKRNTENIKYFVLILICCNHITKAISTQLHAKVNLKEIRTLSLFSFGLLQNCVEFSTALILWKNIYIIFNSTNKTPMFVAAYNFLISLIESDLDQTLWEEDTLLADNFEKGLENTYIEVDLQINETITAQSKFKKDFDKVISTIVLDLDLDENKLQI